MIYILISQKEKYNLINKLVDEIIKKILREQKDNI